MANRLPKIGEWYEHTDENELLKVLDTSFERETVTVQRLDGHLQEFDLDEWHGLPLESIDPPDADIGAEDELELDEIDETPDPELSLDEEGITGFEEPDDYN